MDKQQKLEYQNRIENYLSKEHVYDLFEDLLKQLVVKQPDDPISFLIDKLSVPQSTSPSTQPEKYSSLAPPASRSGSSLSRSVTTTSWPPSQSAISWKRKSQRNKNSAKRSSPTLSTTPSSRTTLWPNWWRRRSREFRRRRRASSFQASPEQGSRDWPCRGKASSLTPSSFSTCHTTRFSTTASTLLLT